MNDWNWTPKRNLGIWRHGALWLRPLVAATPYLTVGLLLLMLYVLSGTLSISRGTVFDLPAGDYTDFKETDLVAVLMPVSRDTMIFFDDSRYLLDDEGAMRSFRDDLSARLGHAEKKTLLLLADRRIPSGRLMELVAQVRACGVERVLVAGRSGESAE